MNMKILKTTMSAIEPSPIDLNSELIQTPSNQKVEASKRIVNQMVASGQLTPEGEAWLKLNTDPWHDNKTTGFRGVPSKRANQVVTMSIVQEIPIAKPAGMGAGNWGVRISTNPIANSIPMEQYTMGGNVLYKFPVGPGSEFVLNPVQVDYKLDTTADFSIGTSSTGLEIPKEYCKGPFQVASMGLEVINTTATLQRQGLATCAVMNQGSPQAFSVQAINVTGPSQYQSVYSAYEVKTPPQNLKEMLLLPGTTQWEASEGAYSVVQLTEMDSPPTNTPRYPIYTGTEFNNEGLSAGPAQTQVTTVAAPQLVKWLPAPYNAEMAIPKKFTAQVPMNSTIQMYTGLSDQTTLTLRVRWIITRFPNDNEPEILVLAFNSAPWDPVAIEIQSRLCSKLPPAVMFKLNPKGEWWKSMIAGIADIASSGLMMMPHPLAKGAGAAIAAGRAILLPDNKVNFKATTTKTGGTPAQRANKQAKRQAKASPKKKKKKSKAIAAA